jgi:hypothetical protein
MIHVLGKYNREALWRKHVEDRRKRKEQSRKATVRSTALVMPLETGAFQSLPSDSIVKAKKEELWHPLPVSIHRSEG